jgi:hypothetical protein
VGTETKQTPQHTPGPWKVEHDGDFYVITPDVVHGDAEAVDELLAVYVSKNPATREANARLISAAPEMLEALKAIIRDLPAKRDWLDPVIEAQAKAAINRAERGETR